MKDIEVIFRNIKIETHVGDKDKWFYLMGKIAVDGSDVDLTPMSGGTFSALFLSFFFIGVIVGAVLVQIL